MPHGAISQFQVFRVLSLGINKSNQIMFTNIMITYRVQLHIVSLGINLFTTVISATAVKIKKHATNKTPKVLMDIINTRLIYWNFI